MPLTLTERLVRYRAILEKKIIVTDEEQKIAVNEAVGAIAFYYEKIRNVIDYADEHLLRQNAIRRILSRRLIIQQEPEQIAAGLLRELIRSRYLQNNIVPQSSIGEVAKIVSLYLGIISGLHQEKSLSDKDQDWLVSIAACAIDEALVPMTHEEALVKIMYDIMEPLVPVAASESEQKTRFSQIYIAVYRILMRPDIWRMRFLILKQSFPEWMNVGTDCAARAHEYSDVSRRIDALIHHPLNKKYQGDFRRFRIPFVVLNAAIQNNSECVMDPDVLEKEVRRICENLYITQHSRLYSRGVRAFVYIFLTKMVLGLSIELPYDLITIHHVNGLPLFVNVFFPPILLAAIAFTVSFPGEENTAAIVRAIKEIVYVETPAEIFVTQKKRPAQRNSVLTGVFTFLYVVVFGVSFGVIGWFLQKLHFNIMSGIIFFLFFSLITFFGITLRRQVRELVVLKPKQKLGGILLDTFFLPILQVGHWLSFNISRVNVFIFIFDILIELPLQALLEITEEWFGFIKEKKEETE